MSNYNPIYKTLWTSQKFTQLDSTGKLVYLYLLSNEKTKQTGIYNILPKHIACDCELPNAEVESAMEQLVELGMVRYWKEENLVFIHKFFKYSRGTIKNPRVLDKTISRQRELLDNAEVWELFDAEFEDEISLINDALVKNQTNNDIA